MRLGKRLRFIMVERDLNQDGLAEACGIQRPTVNKYISGKINPTLRTLLKMADALGMTVSELLEGVDDV